MRSLLILVIFIMLPFPIPPADSSLTPVKAKLHHTVGLTCKQSCSGLVQWIIFQSDHTVAQCSQTSCVSDQGFNMVHDQYLNGNITLIITTADYKHRRLYICKCDGREICRMSLLIETVEHFIEVERGGSLSITFSITESVKVTFNRNGDDQNSVVIYEVDERKVRSHSEYKERVSSNVLLTLKDLRDSDSGVYTVWDTLNKEVISTYNVTVTGFTTNGTSVDTNQSLPTGEPAWEQMQMSHVVLVTDLSCLFVGMLLGYFVIPMILTCCNKTWSKVKHLRGRQREADHTSCSAEEVSLQQKKVALELQDS